MRSFSSQSIPKPTSGSDFILPKGPLHLEIGSGAGLFAVRWAEKNQDAHLLTIERHKTRFEKLERRLKNNGPIENVTPVRDNAIWWITHCLPNASIDHIYLMYPNPYPNHPNRRWARMPFMERLVGILKPGGRLTMTTNELFYLEEAQKFLVDEWGFNLESCEEIAEDQVPRSHFERKFLHSKQPCWELNFIR